MRLKLLALSLSILAASCDSPRSASAAGRPAAAPLRGLVFVNEAIQEISFSATFHQQNAEAGSWQLIAEEGGTMAPLSCFTTDVSPAKFYQSLKAIGAQENNNVNAANVGAEAIAAAGDELSLSFDWKGQSDRVPLPRLLREVVPDLPSSGGERGIEMRFTGNCTGDDAADPPCHESGSLVCLYTCDGGVVSNARANRALLKREKDAHRYRLNPNIDLADGTRVRVYIRRK